jgi:hypothetical protein
MPEPRSTLDQGPKPARTSSPSSRGGGGGRLSNEMSGELSACIRVPTVYPEAMVALINKDCGCQCSSRSLVRYKSVCFDSRWP